jgi:D-alanyl-lipoteichoic acid acyltransferase DltB (MBOAT superfamily)
LGLNIIVIGILQKIVISNRLGVYVDTVFNSLPSYLGFPLLIALYFFTLQIYLDFLSYTNIARGLAKLFGYDLAINFKFPYFSKSISDFWSRWHISLSSWFRDYVYIPLGGSRVPIHKIFLNIITTFLLSGLWHGAGINFIIWGFLNGIFVFADRLLNLNKNVRSFFENKYISFIRMFITFNLLTLLWVLFRSINLSQAIYIYKNIFNLANYRSGIISILENTNIFEHLELSILVTIPYILYEIIRYSKIKLPSRFTNSIILRYSFYIILFLTLIFLGYFGKQDFYYAKF